LFSMNVAIPKGIEAVAVLPDGTKRDLKAGATSFMTKIKE